MYDARSPATTSYDSRRKAAPKATFTSRGNPSSSSREKFAVALNSPRLSEPARKDVWFGMPGSSDVPSLPSGPGAVGTDRLGPSDELSVLRRSKSKPLKPYDVPKSIAQPMLFVRMPPAAE